MLRSLHRLPRPAIESHDDGGADDGLLADPKTAVQDFSFEVSEGYHDGADLRGVAYHVKMSKMRHQLRNSEYQADERADWYQCVNRT